MEPLLRCFVLSTYEVRNYCFKNRALLVLVFIFDCQRSVKMFPGMKPNNDRQEKVPAKKKRRICLYDPATSVGGE